MSSLSGGANFKPTESLRLEELNTKQKINTFEKVCIMWKSKIPAFFLIFPVICLAKREGAPTKPYIYRYASSILVNTPSIILITFALYFIYKFSTKIDVQKFLKSSLIGWFISTALPLIDNWNDECWNPAIFGAFGAGITFTVIAYKTSKGLKEWIRTIIPIVLFIPLVIAFVVFNSCWQTFLMNLGIPVSW